VIPSIGIILCPSFSPGDVPHQIALTDADIHAMHAADGHEDGDVPVVVVTTRSKEASKLLASGELPVLPDTSNSGVKVRELSVSNMTDDMVGGPKQPTRPQLMLQDYKKFKHGKEVPEGAQIQYLKQHLLAQALVHHTHHTHVMHMPHDLLDPNPANTIDFIMMTACAYSTKNTWYIEHEVIGSPEQKKQCEGEVIQIPSVRGTAKSTNRLANHKSNVLDLIKQMYPKATTLADRYWHH